MKMPMKMPGKMRKLMSMEKSEHGGRLPSVSEEHKEMPKRRAKGGDKRR